MTKKVPTREKKFSSEEISISIYHAIYICSEQEYLMLCKQSQIVLSQTILIVYLPSIVSVARIRNKLPELWPYHVTFIIIKSLHMEVMLGWPTTILQCMYERNLILMET